MELSSARLIEQLTSKCDMWPCFRMRGHLDPGFAGRKALKTCYISKVSDSSSGAHIPPFKHAELLSTA